MASITTGQGPWAGQRAFWEKICIAAFVLALACLADALVSGARKPANHLDLVLGAAIPVAGKVYGKAQTAQDLSVSGAPGLKLVLEEKIFSGFWLGEPMWRGLLSADQNLTPGDYLLKIDFHDLSGVKPQHLEKVRDLTTYTVKVYPSQAAKREGEISLIKRHTGLSPWLVSLCALPVILLSASAVFILSGRIEKEMSSRGMAEIFRVKPRSSGVEFFFGLGTSTGLEPGDRLQVLASTGSRVGEAVVEEIGPETSSAVAKIPGLVPGYFVAKIQT